MASSINRRIECTLSLRRPKDVRMSHGQLAGIIGTELVDVLSAQEPIHREFANLPSSESSVVKFVKRWGRVTSGDDEFPKTLRHSQELLEFHEAAKVTQALRAAHPKSETDWDAPLLFWESQPQILRLRDTLRNAWEGEAAALRSVQDTAKEHLSSTLAFKKGGIEITAHDAWALACLLFLLDHASGKTVICENPTCPAKYFIAGRKNQKFCGKSDCFAFAAKERVTAWWSEHGNEWRAERRKRRRK